MTVAMMRRPETAQEAAFCLGRLPFPRTQQRSALAATRYHHRTLFLACPAAISPGRAAASFSEHSPLSSRARESLGPTAITGSRLLSASVSNRSDHTRLPLRPAYQSPSRYARTLAPGDRDIVGQEASRRPSTSTLPSLGDKMSAQSSSINTRPAPPMRAYTPPLPDPDSSSTFLTDQIAKQQRSNFHSTSLRNVTTMVSQSVNKTALHPKGVEYVLVWSTQGHCQGQ